MKNIKTNLKAGASFQDGNAFLKTYLTNLTNELTYPLLQEALDNTMDACKAAQPNNDKACNYWARSYRPISNFYSPTN